MNKKKVIWIIGSNATGKTTQSKLIHKKLNNGDESKLFVDMDLGDGVVKATQFKQTAHVGFLRDNQCTGTDTINSKESIDATFCYLMSLDEVGYIVIDGIMATATWIDIFTQFPDLVDVYLILLQFDDVIDNLKRVVERRVYKQIDKGGNDGADIELFEVYVEKGMAELEDKTIKNVSGKFTGFKSMYEKVKGRCKEYTQVDAADSVESINHFLVDFIQDELPF